MKLFSNMGHFFTSLTNSLHKKDMKVDLEHSFEELTTTLQPMYSLSPMPNIKGTTYDRTDYLFKKYVNNYRGNPFTLLAKTIDTILDNQDELMKLINHEFTDENLKVVSDYYKLNIVKYVEAITFISDYARMWISVVVWEANNKEGIKTKSPLLDRDRDTILDDNMVQAYASAINMLNQPIAKFLDSIKDLKGHTYNDQDWEGSTSGTNVKLDPYKSNFIPVDWNPFYHIGLMLNAWRVKRHERNQVDLARLQIMLMSLEEAKKSTQNPEKIASLEKQINYYHNEANKIDMAIHRVEEGSHHD